MSVCLCVSVSVCTYMCCHGSILCHWVFPDILNNQCAINFLAQTVNARSHSPSDMASHLNRLESVDILFCYHILVCSKAACCISVVCLTQITFCNLNAAVQCFVPHYHILSS